MTQAATTKAKIVELEKKLGEARREADHWKLVASQWRNESHERDDIIVSLKGTIHKLQEAAASSTSNASASTTVN